METCCDDFKENIFFQLWSLLAIADMAGAKWDIEPWKYCPYCGSELPLFYRNILQSTQNKPQNNKGDEER